MRNFHWIKISSNPATIVLQKIFAEENFTNAIMVTISSMQISTQDKKICMIKFLLMRAGGKIGKNFSPGETFYEYSIHDKLLSDESRRLKRRLRRKKRQRN